MRLRGDLLPEPLEFSGEEPHNTQHKYTNRYREGRAGSCRSVRQCKPTHRANRFGSVALLDLYPLLFANNSQFLRTAGIPDALSGSYIPCTYSEGPTLRTLDFLTVFYLLVPSPVWGHFAWLSFCCSSGNCFLSIPARYAAVLAFPESSLWPKS